MKSRAAPVILLMGPTASGKTALAVELCGRLPVQIVSVDCAQVYRGLDIGTGKPEAAIRQRAPHRLIDICDVSESYSAARFCEDAAREIVDIRQAGHVPLLVGGTFFYAQALIRGLAELPSADADVRREIEQEAVRVGWPALHARLRGEDPETAARIETHDRQRITRALEILRLTGHRPSTHFAQPPVARDYDVLSLVLNPASRQDLHARINARFLRMVEAGLVRESEWLFGKQLATGTPALRLVGYRQAGEYLMGRIHYNQFVAAGQAATRQLAKRQLTWLRHTPDLVWMDAGEQGLAGRVEAWLRQQRADWWDHRSV